MFSGIPFLSGCLRTALLLLLTVLVQAVPVFSQVLLKDPGIPDYEKCEYLQTEDGAEEMVTAVITRIDSGGSPFYLYNMESSSRDVSARIDPETFSVYYSEVLEKSEFSSILTTNSVLDNRIETENDELLITDLAGMAVCLRGFPWEKFERAELVFPNSSGNFRMILEVRGTEMVDANGIPIECYKLRLSMKGLLGGILPKTYLWYSADAPHYLVRSESAGFQGKGKTVLKLSSYSAH